MFDRIALFGLGLLGGSLCKALRRLPGKRHIVAYARNPEKLSRALEESAVDELRPMGDFNPAGTSLIVIATPVLASIEILKNILDHRGLESSALVIDMGSAKCALAEEALRHERADRFVGCHPMAGSEMSGYEHSREDLYSGACVIITPHRRNSYDDIERIRRFWQALDARTSVCPPERHDAAVARSSHAVHLAACALADILRAHAQGMRDSDIRDFIGNGFRDSTRIAKGSPVMWGEILRANGHETGAALDELIERLNEIRRLLSRGGEGEAALAEFLERARGFRDSI